MSVQEYKARGPEAYAEWKAAEVARRRIARKPEVIEVEKIVIRTVEVPAPAPDMASTHIPPPELADLIYVHETPEQANLRLVRLYADAMGKSELARTRDGMYEGKSVTEWIRSAEHYESGLKWNRGRMAETI